MANRMERELSRDREAFASAQNIWNNNYDPYSDPGPSATSALDGLPSSQGSSSNR